VRTREAIARLAGPRQPLLILARKPATAVILDRPAGGCGVVLAGGKALRTVCSTTRPRLRLTVLPRPPATMTVHGIEGVRRIELRLERSCPHVCEHRL
jgi:hypothetical protein